MTTVTANGSPIPTGTGAAITPYNMTGYLTNGQITLSIQNQGTNPMNLRGISDHNSPISWQLNTGASSCQSNTTTLAVGDSCTLIYDYMYNINSSAMGGGISIQQNLITPTLVFLDTTTNAQFSLQPPTPTNIGNTQTIYANSVLATLINNAILTGNPGNENLIITSSLTDANGYSPVVESALVANTWLFTAPPSFSGSASSSCSYNIFMGVYIPTCSYNNGQTTITTYPINSLYPGSTIEILFKPELAQNITVVGNYFTLNIR
jgi:hypothetical protein